MRTALLYPCVLAASLLGGPPLGAENNPEDRPARVLMIGVDAIPFEVVQAATSREDAPILTHLRGPSAVISTFPSSSYVAWAGILEPFGVEKSLGYEARYFDLEAQAVTGGLSLEKVPAPWKDFFRWKMQGLFNKAIAYGWPEHHSVRELEKGLEEFLASDEPAFSLYIVTTDGLGHTLGPRALDAFLDVLDERLRQLASDNPDLVFHTVIFSDHGLGGGEPLENTWPGVEGALQSAGYQVTEKLEEAGDVAIVSFGLLSSFVAYTIPDEAEAAAKVMVSTEGVDLCVTRGNDGWHVQNANGSATLRRREDEGQLYWSYQPRDSDPLSYSPVIAQLRERAGDSTAEFFPDAWWFEASKHLTYPDALYRLAHGFELAENSASVLCSISPGYMFGARTTEYMAVPTVGALRWTHGTLHRNASLGFLMTDIPGWDLPDAVRYNQALEFIARKAGSDDSD